MRLSQGDPSFNVEPLDPDVVIYIEPEEIDVTIKRVAIAWALYELVRQPDILRELRTEISIVYVFSLAFHSLVV